jgi:hypothetical protein
MASIDKFNDHCWKDVVPEADMQLYAGWRRETFVGPRPALLAIDLYDLVYRGGPQPPSGSTTPLSTPAASTPHLRPSRRPSSFWPPRGAPASRSSC